jgi:hypothetical protein
LFDANSKKISYAPSSKELFECLLKVLWIRKDDDG